jgi:hypothetical protein
MNISPYLLWAVCSAFVLLGFGLAAFMSISKNADLQSENDVLRMQLAQLERRRKEQQEDSTWHGVWSEGS